MKARYLSSLLFVALVFCQTPWLALVLWAIFVFLASKDRSLLVSAFFFFAAFFTPTGYFESSFFSLKHLHLVFLLALFLDIHKGRFSQTLHMGFSAGKPLKALFFMILLALFSGMNLGFDMKSFRIAANFLLTLLSFLYLLGLLRQDPKGFKRGLLFFLMGVGLYCLVGIFNLSYDTTFLKADIAHNNHAAFLFTIAVFYIVALWLVEINFWQALAYLFTVIIFFACLIISGCRTSWIGFIANFIFIMIVFCFSKTLGPLKARLASLSYLVILTLSAALLFFNKGIYGRWLTLSQPFTGHGIFVNGQYIDFFSRYSPDILKRVFDSSPSELIFGRGYLHWITDLHSLYLMIFASSGIVGMSLFIYFLIKLLRSFWQAWLCRNDARLSCVRLAAFCALNVWMITSIMETFFLQFYVWLNIVIVLFLCGNFSKISEIGIKDKSPHA